MASTAHSALIGSTSIPSPLRPPDLLRMAATAANQTQPDIAAIFVDIARLMLTHNIRSIGAPGGN